MIRRQPPLITTGRLVALVATAAISTVLLLPLGIQPAAAAGQAAASSRKPVTFTGMGPLKIGMTEQQAARTGWLSNKTVPWCSLGGGTSAGTGYQLHGPRAARPMQGRVIFRNGKLDTLLVRSGTGTARGIRPGISTAADVVRAYPNSAYSRREAIILGQLVLTVRPKGATYPTQQQLLLSATPEHRVQAVAVPYLPFCE